MTAKKKILVLCLAILVLFLWAYFRPVSGEKLLDHIQKEKLTEIIVKKTIDDGTSAEDLGTVQLEGSAIERFYTVLSGAKVKDIGERAFPFNTNIRYHVFLNNAEGITEGTLKFYEQEAVIFDHAYGDRPAIHKRYSLTSASVKDFFGSLFHENGEIK